MLVLQFPNLTYRTLLLLCAICLIVAQPEGWKMTDRFYGFRYEIHLPHSTTPNKHPQTDLIIQRIVQAADDLACFGWVQEGSSQTIVGEGRCSKARGPVFQERLRTADSAIEKMDALVYEDTKIRLHFATFKVLPKERETCFLDSPHKCKEFSSKTQATSSSSSTSSRSAEL